MVVSFDCPYCTLTSDRKYNIKRHIFRKHSEMQIPDHLLAHHKNGSYSCPYCINTSNRKYNLKEHIKRKHPGSLIPNNLNSTDKHYTGSSPQLLESFSPIYPPCLKYPNYLQNFPFIVETHSNKKATYNNYFLKTFWEFLRFNNFIQNQRVSQFPTFYRDSTLFNPVSIYHEPLSNIDFGKPLLFKIYKCNDCFRDIPTMFNGFEQIKISSQHICNSNCNVLSKINDEYKITIDPNIKEFSINKIFSIIDKKIDLKPKLCLKSIMIPMNFYQQFDFNQNQFNYNEKDNKKNNVSIPFWLQKLLLYEKFIDLENTQENNWALRITSSKDNNTDIKRNELIYFINLTNSTFGLFKFKKDNSIVYYFFTYLQLEINLNDFPNNFENTGMQ